MTTVIAVEHDGGVTLGCDSLITQGGDAHECALAKVFDNGPVTFAVAGDLSGINALRYMDVPDLDTWDIDRWVQTRLLPAVRDAVDRAGVLGRDPEGRVAMWVAPLVVVAGRVYEISADTSWLRRADGVYTQGSGHAYARGALHVLGGARPAGSNVHHDYMVRAALEAAAAYNPGTGGTLHVRTVARRPHTR